MFSSWFFTTATPSTSFFLAFLLIYYTVTVPVEREWLLGLGFRWRSVSFFVLVCYLKDMLHEFLYANVWLCTCLKVLYLVAIGHFLRLISVDGPLLFQIDFISNKYHGKWRSLNLDHTLDPIAHTEKSVLRRQIKCDDHSIGISKETIGELAIAFLACCIPNLNPAHFTSFALILNLLEIDAGGRDSRSVELLVNISFQDWSLAYVLISN